MTRDLPMFHRPNARTCQCAKTNKLDEHRDRDWRRDGTVDKPGLLVCPPIKRWPIIVESNKDVRTQKMLSLAHGASSESAVFIGEIESCPLAWEYCFGLGRNKSP